MWYANKYRSRLAILCFKNKFLVLYDTTDERTERNLHLIVKENRGTTNERTNEQTAVAAVATAAGIWICG